MYICAVKKGKEFLQKLEIIRKCNSVDFLAFNLRCLPIPCDLESGFQRSHTGDKKQSLGAGQSERINCRHR